jgi:WD repeat-containing protein 42A
MPILAISGLDHNIKIVSPSADKPTDLEGLKEVTSDNIERRKDNSGDDRYDMLLEFFMRQYRRRRGVRIHDDNESDDNLSSSSEEDDDDDGDDIPEEDLRWNFPSRSEDDDDDSGSDTPRVLHCVPS